MKKIITLITMFVLSVGFLTAQGVFTYQALVYNNGSLVVDDSVDATVTITDGEFTYSQTSRVYASLNGLATIPVGNAENENFNNINWSKAKITVKFAVDNAQVTVADNEQIPAVPYALQANTKLTTPMLITYINGAKKSDMIRINNAMTADLQKAVLDAIIDSMINHYDLSKEIIMEYLSQLDAQDADELFDSLVNNTNREALMRAAAAILLQNLETPAGKDAMLAIAKNYTTNLTAAELDAILDAVSPDVRDVVADSIITYLLRQPIVSPSDNGPAGLDEDIKASLERVAKNYIEYATTDEVQSMITALQNNENHAIDILVDYFNEKYMRDYVDSVVKRYLMANYYYCEEGTPANVCGTTPVCLSVPATFSAPTTSNPGYFTATITYGGDGAITLSNVKSSVKYSYIPNGYDPQSETGSVSIDGYFGADDYLIQTNESGTTVTISVSNDFVHDFFAQQYEDQGPASLGNQLAVFVTFSGIGCLNNGHEKTYQIDIFYNYVPGN